MTVNADVVIYNDQIQTAYLERIQDNIVVFNEASRNGLVLINNAIVGDFHDEAYYDLDVSMQHRDVNSKGKVTVSGMAMDEASSVKVPYKLGPVGFTEEAFKRRGKSPEEASEIIGYKMADGALEGYYEHAIAVLNATIGNDNIVGASFATDGKKAYTKGLRTLGDKASRVVLWMMNGDTYYDAVDQAIGEKLFDEAVSVVYGGEPGTLNKPTLVTDKCPSGKIYGLTAGGIMIEESQAPGVRNYEVNDEENLSHAVRAEGAFNIQAKGYSYDKTAGANPTLAILGAAANWDYKPNTPKKLGPGVVIDLS